MKLLAVRTFFALAFASLLRAQNPESDPDTIFRETAQKVAAGLKYQQGEITLQGGLAKISKKQPLE